jgi:hypothetical protein
VPKGVVVDPPQVPGWSGRHPDDTRQEHPVAESGKPTRVGAHDAKLATPMAGCLAELMWGIGGFAALIALAVTILRAEPWTLSIRDALFWSVVAGMILARFIDVRSYGGKTLLGAPASQKDAWKYALGLAGAASLAWILAQSFRVGPGM